MARIELTKDVMIFFIVMAISALALFFTTNSGMGEVTFMVFSQPKAVFDNTVVISDLSINERFSQDTPALTGTYLNDLKDRTIHTNEGSSRYRQIIRLSDTGQGFPGGYISYQEDPTGEVGDFLTFPQDQPIFEWEAVFSPALESRVENGMLVDLEDERINILGKDYFFSRARVTGDRVELRLFGPSSIEFTDDIDDSDFTERVKVQGKTVSGRVKIMGTISGSRARITSIIYQFDADHRLGGDVLVPPRKGVRQYLREPEGMLNPFFEIIYGGIRGGRAAPQVAPRPVASSNSIIFKPSGDQYRLIFTNVVGQAYVVPFASIDGGSLVLGDDDGRSLVVREGSSDTNYNINQGDLFVVTSDDDIKGRTNIFEFDEASVSRGEAYFVDLSGSSTTASFDSTTGRGVIHAGGTTYDFRVDINNPDRIVVDQDNDGSFDSDKADFVANGGIRLQVGSTSSSSISLDLRTPKRLFDNADSDEVVDFTIVRDGSNINLVLSDQTNLDLESGRSGIDQGMTPFGNLFLYDEDDEESELAIQLPTGGRSPGPYVRSGQAAGWVIMTLELDRLLSAAAERLG